jgi:pimeloyl-ACP methyl ester carboxylesterase
MIIIPLIAIGLIVTLILLYKDKTREELELKYAPEPSKFIFINGTRVHYRDEGEGPVIVLLHGVLSSLHTWDGWLKELAGRYRIVRLDLPGWGLTGKAGFPYNMPVYIDFLNEFFNKIGLVKIYLVGSSFGGLISWNYAIKYPDKVNKLILLDSTGYPIKKPLAIKVLIMPLLSFFQSGLLRNILFQQISGVLMAIRKRSLVIHWTGTMSLCSILKIVTNSAKFWI